LGATGIDLAFDLIVACGGCREASLNTWQNINAKNTNLVHVPFAGPMAFPLAA